MRLLNQRHGPPYQNIKGEQSGAVVAPETAEKLEYTGTQSGAIVEPEQVAHSQSTKGFNLVPLLNQKSMNQRLKVPSQVLW